MKSSITPIVIAFTLLLSGICTRISAQTYNYIPDSTFDGNGLMSFIYFNNIDRLYDCTLQADDKPVMAGLSKNPATGYFELCITRLNNDGSFDSSFHNTGTCFVSMGPQQSIGGMTPKIKIAPDGKIVVAGSGSNPNGGSLDIMVCRLDTNGFLDPTFNGTGVLFVDMTGANTQPDQANALDIDALGNIYAAGVTRTGGTPLDNDFAVVKIRFNGQLDQTFNGNGKKLFNPTGTAEFSRGIRIQNDGKIVLAGEAGANMYALRFDSTGTLDPTFNTTGTVNIVFQLGSDMGAMDIDSLGRIIVVGQLATSSSNIAVARLLPNGAFDPNFGFNGKYFYNVGGLASFATDLYIQPDMKILIGGYSNSTSTGNDFMATRVDTGGVIDITFNTLGYVTQPVIGGLVNEECNGMAVKSDGRILLTGTVVYSSAVNEDLGLVRLRPVPASSTGITEGVLAEHIRISPNPFSGELIITSNLTVAASIIDMNGKTVLPVQLTDGINRIDTSVLPQGLYLLNIPGKGTARIVKQQ